MPIDYDTHSRFLKDSGDSTNSSSITAWALSECWRWMWTGDGNCWFQLLVLKRRRVLSWDWVSWIAKLWAVSAIFALAQANLSTKSHIAVHNHHTLWFVQGTILRLCHLDLNGRRSYCILRDKIPWAILSLQSRCPLPYLRSWLGNNLR